MFQFLLSGLNQGICPVLDRVVLKRSESGGTMELLPPSQLLLWGQCLLVCSQLGLHNDDMAYGDPYCCGHTSGVAVWEIMLLMSGFLSSVRILGLRPWEYLCKCMGNRSLKYL